MLCSTAKTLIREIRATNTRREEMIYRVLHSLYLARLNIGAALPQCP